MFASAKEPSISYHRGHVKYEKLLQNPEASDEEETVVFHQNESIDSFNTSNTPENEEVAVMTSKWCTKGRCICFSAFFAGIVVIVSLVFRYYDIWLSKMDTSPHNPQGTKDWEINLDKFCKWYRYYARMDAITKSTVHVFTIQACFN